MKTVHIFAAGEYGPEPETEPGAYIIAADGGLSELARRGVTPDLIVGDFDSYSGALPREVEVLRHPVMKDDTDTALALYRALELGAERVVLHGALGGRLDHTLANIQLLTMLARRGIPAYASGGRECAAAVSTGELRFGEGFSGTVSVFALGGTAEVSETGLLYGLDRFPLRDDVPRGVSNEFTGAPSLVTVHSGTALAIWEARNRSFPEIRFFEV